MAVQLACCFQRTKNLGGIRAKSNIASLPQLKTGVFSPARRIADTSRLTAQMIDRLNYLFAKDWNIWRDVEVIGQMLRR